MIFSKYLLHNASLSLGEGCVPSQLVVDELHFDLHLVEKWIIWGQDTFWRDWKKKRILPHPSFCLLAIVGGGRPIGLTPPSTRRVRPKKWLTIFANKWIWEMSCLTLHGPRTGHGEGSVSEASARWSPRPSWAAPSCPARHPLLTASSPAGPSVATRTEGGGPERIPWLRILYSAVLEKILELLENGYVIKWLGIVQDFCICQVWFFGQRTDLWISELPGRDLVPGAGTHVHVRAPLLIRVVVVHLRNWKYDTWDIRTNV